jgi:hypothetical protein
MKQIILVAALFALGLGACSPTTEATLTPAPTDVPTITPIVFPTLPPAFTAVPAPATLTPSATPLLVEPLTGIEVEPPFTLMLPQNWRYGYDTLLYQDVGEVKSVPIALYKGAVTGGTGTIVLVWNFRSVTTANPLSPDYGKPNLWVDGLRLLRALVFDARCNIGTEPEKQYRIGDLPAVGTSFAAVDCPDTPDTRGWFAGVTVENVNFVFYVYTDPISAMDGQAQAELTAILESVRFDFSQFRVPRNP